jgi:hypothetical protein
MKTKLSGIFLILASLSAVSCRETEEFSSASSNENNRIISSRIQIDTTYSFNDPEKDPPIIGQHWKIGK